MSDVVTALSGVIDSLAANVFAKVPLFGVEVEGIVLWLAAPMVLFTLYLGFPNLRALPLALRVVRGHFHDPTAPGSVSQFAALSTALSGTVGLGNIAGTAIGISIGGPGAAFWMFVIAWFAMTLKMAEVTLGVRYRIEHADGSVSGGPMYTLSRGLAGLGLQRTGKFLAVFYAICALGGAIPLLQVNQSYAQVSAVTGLDNGWIYGILLAIAVGAVVVGSIGWIATVTSRLVPAMCIFYLAGCAIILFSNITALPDALLLIIRDAFSADSVAGGAIGAFVVGMRRTVYSTEAGIGSAVIAHSAAQTREPVSEGLVALLEPFIDTVVICTITAVTIVVAGTYAQGLEGVAITSAAFASVASWFPYVLAVAVFLFAYSTLIAWGYYGIQAWSYLFGHSKASQTFYRLLYCVMLPFGAVLDLSRVVNLIDSMFFLMAIPNIIGLYLLAPELKRMVSDYLRRVKSGEIKPSA
ncbi:alanine/glycine:cation symporter family protein [Pedomonas mirosovicensis]|uniref:alanine/glycine:cation symporter family protein n=1 Tax=Pedomonas mirosovicensis TaxID=2908641 RepID=UPI002166FD7A|nr:alanine/glycine:cation symporter family protein [Pedomonas mirosovicensis]MCH8684928.1 alanine:cation symporter family protein [Pedomonas mirosovicensis]